jgi:hypothetical protein
VRSSPRSDIEDRQAENNNILAWRSSIFGDQMRCLVRILVATATATTLSHLGVVSSWAEAGSGEVSIQGSAGPGGAIGGAFPVDIHNPALARMNVLALLAFPRPGYAS